MEFEILMDKLDISFSRKKWKHIYREIDRNFDDKVSRWHPCDPIVLIRGKEWMTRIEFQF